MLNLTPEFLPLMLGARWAGVIVAIKARALDELIGPGRGAITVQDRDGLVALADGSCGVLEREYARVIGT